MPACAAATTSPTRAAMASVSARVLVTGFERGGRAMREFLNLLRRSIVVSILVLTTAGMSCTSADQNVRFAPGYGYIVVVSNKEAISQETSGDYHQYYAVFETEDAARKWAVQ